MGGNVREFLATMKLMNNDDLVMRNQIHYLERHKKRSEKCDHNLNMWYELAYLSVLSFFVCFFGVLGVVCAIIITMMTIQ